jgi:hypothetical protein
MGERSCATTVVASYIDDLLDLKDRLCVFVMTKRDDPREVGRRETDAERAILDQS